MTRTFPSPYEGLHPAFPAPEPAENSSPHVTSLSFGGVLGICAFAIDRIAGLSTRPARSGAMVSAYTCVGFLTLAIGHEHDEGERARTFLSHHGIEVPKRRLYDRLGYFDQDDGIVLGSLGGFGRCVAVEETMAREGVAEMARCRCSRRRGRAAGMDDVV